MAYLVDIDGLVKALLDQHLPDVTALPETDVDAIDELPLVIFAPGTGRFTANGPRALAQVWPVTFVVLDTQRGGRSALANARSVADDLTRVLIERFPRARVPGVGVVTSLGDDVALFTRTAQTSIDARDVAQFTGAFELIVRPMPEA